MIHFLTHFVLWIVAVICALVVIKLLYSISVIAFKLVLMCGFLWLLISVINYMSANK
jgi:hypothetical protein